MLNTTLLQAAGSNPMIMNIAMFGLLAAAFYFLLIRPQRKKQKETESMLSAMKKGDKVTTIGGIKGVIQSVKEKTVVVKVDDNTKLEFLKSAISEVGNKDGDKKADKKGGKADKNVKVEAAAEEKDAEAAAEEK